VMAILFQALAAICAAVLTIGRPFMRNEDRRHKVLHTLVGFVGIACIVTAGYLSWSSQSNLQSERNELTSRLDQQTSKLDQLQSGITSLGDKIGASGDAASVLAETAKTLDRMNSRVTTLDERLAYSEVAQLNIFGLKGMAAPPLEEIPTELSRTLSPYVHISAAGIMSWDCTSAALAAYDAAIGLNDKFPFAYVFKGGCEKQANTPDWKSDIENARRILLITTTIPGQNPSHAGVLKMIQSGDFGSASQRGG
jgi:hypothetical protein